MCFGRRDASRCSPCPRLRQALPKEQFTPVVASVTTVPQPVPATDGRQHIAYELLVTNVASLAAGATATIESIKTISKGRMIDTLAGDELAARVTSPSAPDDQGRVLAPGQSGYILMDMSLPLKAKLPKRLVHRFTVSLSPPSPVNVKTYRTAPTTGRHPQAAGDRFTAPRQGLGRRQRLLLGPHLPPAAPCSESTVAFTRPSGSRSTSSRSGRTG